MPRVRVWYIARSRAMDHGLESYGSFKCPLQYLAICTRRRHRSDMKRPLCTLPPRQACIPGWRPGSQMVILSTQMLLWCLGGSNWRRHMYSMGHKSGSCDAGCTTEPPVPCRCTCCGTPRTYPCMWCDKMGKCATEIA